MHADAQNIITKEIMPIKHTMISQPHILHGYTTRTPSATLLELTGHQKIEIAEAK